MPGSQAQVPLPAQLPAQLLPAPQVRMSQATAAEAQQQLKVAKFSILKTSGLSTRFLPWRYLTDIAVIRKNFYDKNVIEKAL